VPLINYSLPPRAGRPSVTYKKHKFPLLQPARVVRSPQTLHADTESHEILKGVNHFSIQRIVFPAGAKMLIFWSLTHWVNLIPSGCHGNLPVTRNKSISSKAMHYRQDIVTRIPITRVELITILIVTILSIWHNSAAIFLRFGKYMPQIC